MYEFVLFKQLVNGEKTQIEVQEETRGNQLLSSSPSDGMGLTCAMRLRRKVHGSTKSGEISFFGCGHASTCCSVGSDIAVEQLRPAINVAADPHSVNRGWLLGGLLTFLYDVLGKLFWTGVG